MAKIKLSTLDLPLTVYAVMDSFHGTFAECSCETVESLWLDKDKALAVASATYQGSVESFTIRDGDVPQYAEKAYKAILKLRKQGKTDISAYDIQKALTK